MSRLTCALTTTRFFGITGIIDIMDCAPVCLSECLMNPRGAEGTEKEEEMRYLAALKNPEITLI
jgi:hypothetical protein